MGRSQKVSSGDEGIWSGEAMKIEPRGLADGWDRNYVIKQKKSRSVAGFVT